VAPPQGPPHVGVNIVHPSLIQQYQNFEQLNTTNPTHQSNNAKKKGKIRNNNNLRLRGNQNHPQHNQPTGGNHNHRKHNPQGGNQNKRQGNTNNNLQKNFPCSLYGVYGHYTLHFPQITDFKLMKYSISGPHPPTPPAPQQAPQQ
jgi:hypothetical protein